MNSGQPTHADIQGLRTQMSESRETNDKLADKLDRLADRTGENNEGIAKLTEKVGALVDQMKTTSHFAEKYHDDHEHRIRLLEDRAAESAATKRVVEKLALDHGATAELANKLKTESEKRQVQAETAMWMTKTFWIVVTSVAGAMVAAGTVVFQAFKALRGVI